MNVKPNSSAQPLLSVRNLCTWFDVKKGILNRKQQYVKAVNNVSFDLYKNETLGIVGESGCGKTTLGRTILKLEKAVKGSIEFNGYDILKLEKDNLKDFRSNLSIIFQDPFESLNPRMTVGDIISEPIEVQTKMKREDRIKRVVELMELTGLDPIYMQRYPHEFSGGQRQRIGIARSLALLPKVMICDEPVSALDVSIQSQILNLLVDIQKELGLSYIFISHDLNVVQHISDRIAVMYLGRIVELSKAEDFSDCCYHPYTQLLKNSVLKIGVNHAQISVPSGELPSPVNLPKGCVFHTRCPYAQSKCKEVEPDFSELKTGHFVACHYAQQIHSKCTNK